MKTPALAVTLVVVLLGCGVEQPMNEPAPVDSPPVEQPPTQTQTQTTELTGFPCEVREVLQAACAGCHAHGATMYVLHFSTRHDFANPARTPRLADVVAERLSPANAQPMPPAGAVRQLTEPERQLLTSWLAQGAPAGACGELTR